MARRRMRAKGAGRAALAALLTAVLIVALGALVWDAAQRRALDGTRRAGEAALALHAEMTRGWLARFSALPPIYARHPGLVGALRHPEDGIRRALLNQELALWTSVSGGLDAYVMDAQGVTIAASNWDQPRSFVGKDFSFRPYFKDAALGESGRFFALGTTSGQRGYYFAAPVRDDSGLLGVVVVKAGVEEIERELSAGGYSLLVEDRASGVVIIAGDPVWRLTTLRRLDAAQRAAIAAVRQFDLDGLSPAPMEADGGDVRTAELVHAPGPDGMTPQLHLTREIPEEGWVLHLLAPVAPARREALILSLLAAAAALLAAMGAALVWQRRRRLLDRLRERERAQARLERRVEARTADLRTAIDRLRDEITEKEHARAELERTQEELAQAGKLAALGQMSAALSHEFNQPLTAIRTYAANAGAFVEAGRNDRALDNLARVQRLTERMAQLSKSLTRFARKPDDEVSPVPLSAVLREARELMHGRLERSEAALDVTGEPEALVLGGQVRLQHVVMNLIANALDAAEEAGDGDGAGPRIRIHVARREGTVEMSVEDDGPGIPDEVLPRVFDPFFTTRRKGLGLGLSICFNIVRDFGGAMRADNLPEGGARFVVSLRAAEDGLREAAE